MVELVWIGANDVEHREIMKRADAMAAAANLRWNGLRAWLEDGTHSPKEQHNEDQGYTGI